MNSTKIWIVKYYVQQRVIYAINLIGSISDRLQRYVGFIIYMKGTPLPYLQLFYLFIYFLFIPYLKKVTLLVKDYSTKRPSISHNKYIQYDNTKRDIVQT